MKTINKHIKNKKKDKLKYKKIFIKEDLLFLKKYPRLYSICKVNNISREQVKQAIKKINKVRLCTKDEIECVIRMIIAAEEKKYIFKESGRGDYYKKLFNKIGIKF